MADLPLLRSAMESIPRVTPQRNGEHHEVVPNHNPIRIGTLTSILKSVAEHHRMDVEELFRQLDL